MCFYPVTIDNTEVIVEKKYEFVFLNFENWCSIYKLEIIFFSGDNTPILDVYLKNRAL